MRTQSVSRSILALTALCVWLPTSSLAQIREDVSRAMDYQKHVPEYLQSLVGSLGADPLGPAACLAENQLISWTKAKISLVKDSRVENDLEQISADKIPSLLQRFKTRFRRDRLH